MVKEVISPEHTKLKWSLKISSKATNNFRRKFSQTLSYRNLLIKSIGKEETGRVRWLTPVIPALWEAKVGRSLEVRSLRPA